MIDAATIDMTAALLVDGESRPAAGGRTYPDVAPATGEPFAAVPDATVEDLDQAVRAARHAFDRGDWVRDPACRVACLRALVAGLRASRERLRELLVGEGGVPVRLTRSIQLDGALDEAGSLCDLVERHRWLVDLPTRGFHGFSSGREVRAEPVGVVALITPANFPLALLLRSLVLALGAGNTVVLKVSPHTPLAGLAVGAHAVAAGFPPGVLNVVSSAHPAHLGTVLAAHPSVDLVGLTGSTAAGRAVAYAAAATLKRLVLNLGGAGAHVVLDGADDGDIAAAGARVCFHAGQACSLYKRVLVPRARYAEALELLADGMAEVPIGNPADPDVLMGPLVSAELRDRVLAVSGQAERAGGRVIRAGRALPAGGGFYVEPVLIADLSPDTDLARHELPGPALVALPYDDVDHAVALADGPAYGLSAAVSGGPPELARAVAARLRAGAVSVHGGLPYGPDAPFAARRGSGNGHHGGGAALADFLTTKVVGYPA
ncbi:aldehyde dehydrogenase family protein [Actinokineospora enzanensis]|uniref:aldehyde dehydrogenase family protein n=1 Tax=Actinokineospora enzanensis TaxID=155975 RepID=UPI000362C146|nr:aldehyde dehydrogenase family protein [Actinokineospora enzanensis]